MAAMYKKREEEDGGGRTRSDSDLGRGRFGSLVKMVSLRARERERERGLQVRYYVPELTLTTMEYYRKMPKLKYDFVSSEI
jgi:hypothetical protein